LHRVFGCTFKVWRGELGEREHSCLCIRCKDLVWNIRDLNTVVVRATKELAFDDCNLERDGFLFRLMPADVAPHPDSVGLPNIIRRLHLRDEELDPPICLVSSHEPRHPLWCSPRALHPFGSDHQQTPAVNPTGRPGEGSKVHLYLFESAYHVDRILHEWLSDHTQL
jgi:hypothetical protein